MNFLSQTKINILSKFYPAQFFLIKPEEAEKKRDFHQENPSRK
jgi:hypothetical protein